MNAMWRWSGVLLLVAACVTSVRPTEALGMDRGWYLNGGTGLNHLDVPWGDTEFGIHLVGNAGYQFNRNLALELDSGYIRSAFVVNSRLESAFHQIPLTLNAVYSFANASRFEPIVGAGGGAMFMGYGDRWARADFCGTFKGGMRYGINDHVSVGADYTYYLLGTFSLLSSAFQEKLDPVGNDTVNLTLHWMF